MEQPRDPSSHQQGGSGAIDELAIQKAERALGRAHDAFLSLCFAQGIEPFREAWDDFLHHTDRVVLKLQAGCQSSGRATAWFGRVKAQQRKDELLKYLHQARNVQQHGLLASVDTAIQVGSTGPMYVQDVIILETGEILANFTPALPTSKLVVAQTHYLVPVVDSRFGDVFEPPKVHLGEPIADGSPVGVATLAMSYYSDLVQQAKLLR